MISGRTALYGVMGSPVDHSLSPAMQNAAFAGHRLRRRLRGAAGGARRRCEAALRGAHALGFRGLNVTVPHKEAAVAALRRPRRRWPRRSARSTRCARTPDGWEGFNTDATGRARAARPTPASGRRPGAAARAPAARPGRPPGRSLAMGGERPAGGAPAPEAAEALCPAHGPVARRPDGTGRGRWPGRRWRRRPSRPTWSSTPPRVGLAGPRRASCRALAFRAGQVALDFVYGDTAFARAAAAARRPAGHAASRCWCARARWPSRIWTGRPAPEASWSRPCERHGRAMSR